MTFHFEAWNNTERKQLQLVVGKILRRLMIHNTTEDIFILFTHGSYLLRCIGLQGGQKLLKLF